MDDQNDDQEPAPLRASEQEMIRNLQDMGTNFIFLFGKQGVGKTAIVASLLYYLASECHYGNLEKKGNRKGQHRGELFRQAIASRRFPERSTPQVFAVESLFVPSNNRGHLSKLPLTFLEMDGKSLAEVSIMSNGQLHPDIDIYFKAGTLSLLFLMVTSPQEAQQDDHLMVEFLDYINQKSPRFRDARVLFLISKWDTYSGQESVSDFLKRKMPSTFRRLSKSTNAYGAFSVGYVENNVGGEPFIHEYDSRPARAVFEWIYQTLTGKKLS